MQVMVIKRKKKTHKNLALQVSRKLFIIVLENGTKEWGVIMSTIKQILCNVGNEVYGIELIHVKGIEKYMNIIPVPNTSSYIEGIINLRGEVIPVFSIHDKFNQPKAKITENTKLIIVKSNDILIAFMVDGVSEIVELEESEFQPIPKLIESEKTSYIKSVVQVKGRLVIVLHVDGILTEMEQEKLQSIIEAHQ